MCNVFTTQPTKQLTERILRCNHQSKRSECWTIKYILLYYRIRSPDFATTGYITLEVCSTGKQEWTFLPAKGVTFFWCKKYNGTHTWQKSILRNITAIYDGQIQDKTVLISTSYIPPFLVFLLGFTKNRDNIPPHR
jgi:hypothetical protein